MERVLTFPSSSFEAGTHHHSYLRMTRPSALDRQDRTQFWSAGQVKVSFDSQSRRSDTHAGGRLGDENCYFVLFPMMGVQAQGEADRDGRSDHRSILIWRSESAPDAKDPAAGDSLRLQVSADHFERHWPSLVPRHGLTRLASDGALATLARDSVETLWQRRAEFSISDLLSGFEAALGMLDQSLRQPRRSHRSKGELYQQVMLFIERELENVTLDPLLIAQRHGCSLRALQVLFAEHGSTVAATIRNKRLERCRAELKDSHGDRIGLVAQRWGFMDAAHFSKLFKSAFGQSPRSFRNASDSVTARVDAT